MIFLWLNLHNYLDKVPNTIIYDWRKIHHDRKDSQAILSYVILVYIKRKKDQIPPILEGEVLDEKE
jgi:hypothetical protein